MYFLLTIFSFYWLELGVFLQFCAHFYALLCVRACLRCTLVHQVWRNSEETSRHRNYFPSPTGPCDVREEQEVSVENTRTSRRSCWMKNRCHVSASFFFSMNLLPPFSLILYFYHCHSLFLTQSLSLSQAGSLLSTLSPKPHVSLPLSLPHTMHLCFQPCGSVDKQYIRKWPHSLLLQPCIR